MLSCLNTTSTTQSLYYQVLFSGVPVEVFFLYVVFIELQGSWWYRALARLCSPKVCQTMDLTMVCKDCSQITCQAAA